MLLERFNATARSEIDTALRPRLDIQRWINENIPSRPYPSKHAVLACTGRAASPFADGEGNAALQQRLGQAPDEEEPIVREQGREIARLRLDGVLQA
ncbi:hypothetical protein E3T53_11350 [Cryobacterium psychrophilum]|uniref:Uncharacterized protein n=2 Tax=Cryobacterium psychrophilum TaxID=41988 RepID=A0A4Y8KPC5_9MICO|nr:hypothetical protein E3T53_11350 [Cryobacterium psychrophilum]